MEFSEEETQKLKAMLLFLVKRKQSQSAGHSGFHLNDLKPVLEELEKDGRIELRRTINSRMYFLTKNNNFNGNSKH